MSKSHYLELSYRQRRPLNRVILMWALFHTLLENAQKLKENLMVISCLPTCLGKWYWKVKTSSPSVLITLSTNTHRSLQQEYTNLKLAPVLHTVPLNWYVSPHSPPSILCQASRITVGGCVTYSRGHLRVWLHLYTERKKMARVEPYPYLTWQQAHLQVTELGLVQLG